MPMPKSAVNPLQDLFDLIERGTIERDIAITRGDLTKVYRLRSLYDEDYSWRDRYINIDNPIAMGATLRSPTLAIATVAIDGQPVGENELLTEIDETLPQALKDVLRQDMKFVIAYNLHTKVYSKLPRDYIVELYNKYAAEVELPSRNVTGEKVGEPSASTHS